MGQGNCEISGDRSQKALCFALRRGLGALCLNGQPVDQRTALSGPFHSVACKN